ncbi:MAG: hypothetical protein IJW70_06830, partial [Clostridia bacterium]|nr:hypothetical protein [Clostridia bacterium]
YAVLTQQIFSSPKAFLAGHIGICPREKMQESEKSARQNQLGSTPVRLSQQKMQRPTSLSGVAFFDYGLQHN